LLDLSLEQSRHQTLNAKPLVDLGANEKTLKPKIPSQMYYSGVSSVLSDLVCTMTPSNDSNDDDTHFRKGIPEPMVQKLVREMQVLTLNS